MSQLRESGKSYAVGYFLSLLLTLSSFLLVYYRPVSKSLVIGAIASFALIQAVIQLLLFLHLGAEETPRWRLYSFLFMTLILVIIVGGSLWIMSNLMYRETLEIPHD